MKKISFLIVLFFGLILSTSAQKTLGCTPKLPKNVSNWTMILNSPVGNDVDFSKINFKLNPLKEGTNLSETFKKEADTGISACYLDFFLENQKFIPDDWKKATIIFTGTVFKEDNKYIVYRTMHYNKDEAQWVEGKNYGDYLLENTCSLLPVN